MNLMKESGYRYSLNSDDKKDEKAKRRIEFSLERKGVTGLFVISKEPACEPFCIACT